MMDDAGSCYDRDDKLLQLYVLLPIITVYIETIAKNIIDKVQKHRKKPSNSQVHEDNH